MKDGYGQFCPIAKATEIFATRWTPLVLRALLSGACTFNDIHRGVPLMSRALLAERLRQLEREGIVEKRTDGTGAHPEYRLTATGDAFREVIGGLAQWGLQHARDQVEAHDLDPGLYMWKCARTSTSKYCPVSAFFLSSSSRGCLKAAPAFA
jgi:DNA-binding HxlR family transcriptional regulator